MKKLVILSVAAILFACNSNTKTTETPVEVVENKTADVGDTHNSRNSLDYKGIYKGDLPTASGSGMAVTIKLEDDTFTKEVKYKEQNETFTTNGKYTWNDAGSTITLEGEEKPNQYLVGENSLTQLDIEGNKITGDMAQNYVLKK